MGRVTPKNGSLLFSDDYAEADEKILEPLAATGYLIVDKQGNAKAYKTNITKVKL